MHKRERIFIFLSFATNCPGKSGYKQLVRRRRMVYILRKKN